MKKILLFAVIILLSSLGVIAQTTKTSASGANNWSNAATWTPNGVPDAVDDVIIPSGSVITLDQTDAVRSIDLQSGGFIFVNNAFTVSGASSTNSTIAGDMTVSATLTFSASNVSVTGDISVGAGKQIVFSDTNSQISNTGEITLNSDSSNFSSLIYGGTNYSGAGTFEYNRFISGTSTAWELIGSPVSGQTASDMIGQTNLANNGSDFGIGTYNNAGTGNSGNGTIVIAGQLFDTTGASVTMLATSGSNVSPDSTTRNSGVIHSGFYYSPLNKSDLTFRLSKLSLRYLLLKQI